MSASQLRPFVRPCTTPTHRVFSNRQVYVWVDHSSERAQRGWAYGTLDLRINRGVHQGPEGHISRVDDGVGKRLIIPKGGVDPQYVSEVLTVRTVYPRLRTHCCIEPVCVMLSATTTLWVPGSVWMRGAAGAGAGLRMGAGVGTASHTRVLSLLPHANCPPLCFDDVPQGNDRSTWPRWV